MSADAPPSRPNHSLTASSTRARDDSYSRSFILPYFADEPLAKVNPIQVHKWVSALVAKDYAPGTIRKAYQLLSPVFDAGVKSDPEGVKIRAVRRGQESPVSDNLESPPLNDAVNLK